MVHLQAGIAPGIQSAIDHMVACEAERDQAFTVERGAATALSLEDCRLAILLFAFEIAGINGIKRRQPCAGNVLVRIFVGRTNVDQDGVPFFKHHLDLSG